MRKVLLLALLTGWLSVSCLSLPIRVANPSPLRSLVVVTTTIEGQPSLCTGFIVNLIEVVTAKHCISGGIL